MKTKTYNDKSKSVAKWTEKKLATEYRKESVRIGAGPNTSRMRAIGAEVMKRRRAMFQ